MFKRGLNVSVCLEKSELSARKVGTNRPHSLAATQILTTTEMPNDTGGAMTQNTKQTWDEMKKLYPDQWLQIVEFESDKYGNVASGVVQGHGKTHASLPAPPTDRRVIALQYTGVSTFTGRRGYADHNGV